jgi:hypothetical protein
LSVSIIGAVLNARAIGSRFPAAFVVLGVVVLLDIGVSSLSLGGRRRAQADPCGPYDVTRA